MRKTVSESQHRIESDFSFSFFRKKREAVLKRILESVSTVLLGKRPIAFERIRKPDAFYPFFVLVFLRRDQLLVKSFLLLPIELFALAKKDSNLHPEVRGTRISTFNVKPTAQGTEEPPGLWKPKRSKSKPS